MINDGFRSSEGWNERLKKLIHLFAPLVSGKKIIAANDNIILNVKRKNEKKIRFLRESLGIDDIITIPIMQKIKCFFNNKSDEK